MSVLWPQERPIWRLRHDAMACTFELCLAGTDQRGAEHVSRAVFGEIERIEALLSRFVPHSDVAQINTLKPGHALRVSVETVECLQIADQVCCMTGSAFDVAFRSAHSPEQSLDDEKGPPLVFDPDARTVGVRRAGVVLDLGGIGKGYALDCAVAVLCEWGIASALLHSGQSTVYALGRPPGGELWRVALRDPDEPDRSLGTVRLVDAALSGSGQRLHSGHIIDPRTGRPAATTAAAWCVAPTAALADALSTAFMIMTATDIEALCQREGGLSAMLWRGTGQNAGIVSYGMCHVLVD